MHKAITQINDYLVSYKGILIEYGWGLPSFSYIVVDNWFNEGD